MRLGVLLLLLLAAAPVAGAAVSLTAIGGPQREALTTSWTEVTWPLAADYIRVEIPAGTVLYYTNGCDDAGTVGSDYETWTATSAEPLVLARSTNGEDEMCFAAAAGTPTIALTALRRGR